MTEDKPIPLQPTQDRTIGLPHTQVAGRWVTAYDEKIALSILDRLAEGQTLNEICTIKNAMPHKATFRRWVFLHPDLAKAYREAVQISATSLEEESLDLARAIRKRPGTAVDVRAGEVALGQLRWSAARRDPSKYGERTAVSIAVPIQINTGLNLGEGAGASVTPNIYEVKAQIPQEVVIEESAIKLIPPGKKYDRKAPRKRVLTPRIPAEVKK